jgi:hypothetical protein
MFINKLENELKSGKLQLTENGALGFTSTGKALVDMNFRVSSYRNCSEDKIFTDFVAAFNEHPMLAMRWLFYVRDVRGGLGERRLFRVILSKMTEQNAALVAKVLKLVAVYGRWDDLLSILDTELKMHVLTIIGNQINEDIVNASNGKSISLLAKWMPSINGSNKERVKMAYEIARVFGLSAKAYRQTIVALRGHLDLVETKMSARDWTKIDYAKVPSRANLVYNKAFFAHDPDRRLAFITRVENNEAKIHSATNFPHDIVAKYNHVRGVDRALEVLWKALPNYGSDMGSTLVVADGSGSMESHIANTNISALTVANSLAIYFAEHCAGEFKNTYITFSARPQLVKLGNGTLKEKLDIAEKHSEIANTNIEATFDLILNTALKNKMKQEDLPSTLLIISDMEFDDAAGESMYNYGRYNHKAPNKTLFNVIAEKFAIAGYKMPKLAFWNIMSRTMTIPVIENELGVTLVSGFSPAAIRMVLSGKMSPYDALVDILKSERYDAVGQAILEE